MNSMLVSSFIAAILFTSSAFAQSQPSKQGQPSTTVSGHRLGETFQEWLAINQLDLVEICRPHKRSESKDTDFKAVCKRLSGIRDSGRGEFFLGDAAIKQAFGWTFMDGKLAEVSTQYSEYTMTGQISFLEQAYGPPTSTETVPYQNAYGAKWDCLRATWSMPDGAMIRAAEEIRNLPSFGPTRWLTVTFFSKDRIDSLVQQNQKPNPYVR